MLFRSLATWEQMFLHKATAVAADKSLGKSSDLNMRETGAMENGCMLSLSSTTLFRKISRTINVVHRRSSGSNTRPSISLPNFGQLDGHTRVGKCGRLLWPARGIDEFDWAPVERESLMAFLAAVSFV